MSIVEQLQWKKYPVLNDGFICLVDVMGDDAAIVQAARTSYDKDIQRIIDEIEKSSMLNKDRGLIRRLMNDAHTSPFEMVEFKFKVRVPMDCWRQWIRHRTANVNEYSTRYSEAIDSQQTTAPDQWRLQSSNNKQGSSGFLEEWPEHSDDIQHICDMGYPTRVGQTPGEFLSVDEETFHQIAKQLYQNRLSLGVAREQARKDLPLSTYTEAYWKCDLHNIFNFLRLRLDLHAQLEIRLYAEAMASIIKQICPIAYEAFEDYVLNTRRFSAMEMDCIRQLITTDTEGYLCQADDNRKDYIRVGKILAMTDNEWNSFLKKFS